MARTGGNENTKRRTRGVGGVKLDPLLVAQVQERCTRTLRAELGENPDEESKRAADKLALKLTTRNCNTAVREWIARNEK